MPEPSGRGASADDTPRLDALTPGLAAIRSRRTARHFDPARPLPDAAVARLIELATLAPSEFNLQPWRFVVVRDPGNRRRLRRCAYGDARITEAPVALLVLAYLRPHRTDLDAVAATMVDHAAVDPAGAAKLRATASKVLDRAGEFAPATWAAREAARAATTLLIAAEAAGIASASIDRFDPDQIRAGFGVPDDHAVCGIIALGYAAGVAPFPGRLGLDHVGYAEHFGQPWRRGSAAADPEPGLAED